MRNALIFVLLLSTPWAQASGSKAQSNPQSQGKSADVKNAQNDQQSRSAGSQSGLDEEFDFDISEADLRKAQRDEAEAEMKYYQIQAEKLSTKPESWERIVSLMTPLGAFVAAIVAFLSLGFNYRSTLLNQQDTQFYEALKRFGDKDSPAVRSSAAGLLAELGTRSRFVSRNATGHKLRVWLPRGWKRVQPFLETSLDQLTVGLLLEENPVVLGAVTAAVLKLIELDPWPWLRKLYAQNLVLQRELVLALADFIAEDTKDQLGEVQAGDWRSASAVCGYRPLIIETLAKRLGTHWQLGKTPFFYLLDASRVRLRRADIDNPKVSEPLRIAAMRLRTNVTVLTEAIFHFGPQFPMEGVFLSDMDFGFHDRKKLRMEASQLQDIKIYGSIRESALDGCEFQGADLYSAYLEGTKLSNCRFEGARLSKVSLRNVDFRRSDLRGTKLFDCKLDGALLYGAQIDDRTVLEGTNWWAASFTDPNGGKVDSALLEKLYVRVLSLNTKEGTDRMFGKEMDPSKWLDAAHPSVRGFVEERQRKQI